MTSVSAGHIILSPTQPVGSRPETSYTEEFFIMMQTLTINTVLSYFGCSLKINPHTVIYQSYTVLLPVDKNDRIEESHALPIAGNGSTSMK